MTGTGGERDRQQEITAVVLKVLGVALAVGLVIGGGAWAMVKALGLETSSSSSLGPGRVDPVTPLPTTALPVPGGSSSPDSVEVTPSSSATGELQLSASPLQVQPSERINLTGQWPGHDNESLMVQRFQNGQWADFGVQVRVEIGTFDTYVLTSRTGDQKFRVYDPATKTASNEVTVTVG